MAPGAYPKLEHLLYLGKLQPYSWTLD